MLRKKEFVMSDIDNGLQIVKGVSPIPRIQIRPPRHYLNGVSESHGPPELPNKKPALHRPNKYVSKLSRPTVSRHFPQIRIFTDILPLLVGIFFQQVPPSSDDAGDLERGIGRSWVGVERLFLML